MHDFNEMANKNWLHSEPKHWRGKQNENIYRKHWRSYLIFYIMNIQSWKLTPEICMQAAYDYQ